MKPNLKFFLKMLAIGLVLAVIVAGITSLAEYNKTSRPNVQAQPAPAKVSYEVLHRDDFSKVVIVVNGHRRFETLTCFQYADSPCIITKTGFGVFYKAEHITLIDAPTNGEARCHIDQATIVGESVEMCGFHVTVKSLP